MTGKLIFAFVGAIIIISCNSNQQHDTKENQEQSGINLNNGDKWKVNPEMKPHIEKGHELLAEYISKKGEDYQKLAENLTAQNNSLIQSCTMKGKSHDELHKWLYPHIELIKKLSNAKSVTEAETIIPDFEKSFNTYHNYFE